MAGGNFLAGNFAPVREEVTAFDLPVTGVVPAELTGRFLRNGPNPIGEEDPATYHWFTGTGMVHGIRLRDGKAEWYRNRYVRAPEVAAALGEQPPANPYPDTVRVFAANTNVIGHAGRTFAIVEAGAPPVELDFELNTLAITDLHGTLEHPFSAHPKRDPLTGELHVAAYFWAWGNKIRYLVVDRDARVRRQVDVETAGPTMVHDVAFTERYVLLFDLPCLFDLELAMSGAALPYRWSNDYAARVGLLERDGGADTVQWFEIDPCYVFHPLNAYEDDGGRVVLDAVRHPSVFATDMNGPNDGPTRLDRWTFETSTGKVSTATLDDHPQEFPRHDERLVGRRHRYGYAATFVPSTTVHGPILKHDVVAGTTIEHDFGKGRVGMEPVFVARSPDAAGDDGWILCLVHDATTDGSELVVLDAQDLTTAPVATVHLPQRVPFGFHGNWVPDGQ